MNCTDARHASLFLRFQLRLNCRMSRFSVSSPICGNCNTKRFKTRGTSMFNQSVSCFCVQKDGCVLCAAGNYSRSGGGGGGG